MISYHSIYMGSECNNACSFCEAGQEPRSFDLQTLIEHVDRMSDLQNVVLYGGEPTLHDDLFNLISHLRMRGARRIKLVTNGRKLADSDLVLELVRAGCRLFEIKVEGSHPEMHDTVTGRQGSFEQTMLGLEAVNGLAQSEQWEDGVFLAVRVGIRAANLEDLIGIVSMLVSFGLDRIKLVRKGLDFALSEGAFYVANALRLATLNRTWAECEGFVPCVMKGCERHLVEFLAPRLREGDKPKGCARCDYEQICPGPPEGYVGRYGAREFRAVTGSVYIKDIQQLRAMRSTNG
ncbi:MAG: radical SAM protein [Deltaproteobacteria bacterium]|nr:radical SAM protein [Deltaproteobacteria bacterium]